MTGWPIPSPQAWAAMGGPPPDRWDPNADDALDLEHDDTLEHDR